MVIEDKYDLFVVYVVKYWISDLMKYFMVMGGDLVVVVEWLFGVLKSVFGDVFGKWVFDDVFGG